MKLEPPKELIEAVQSLLDRACPGAATGFTILTPYVCDHCEDAGKEAFPYHIEDASGKLWEHLCNECFEELGCKYEIIDDWEDEDIDNDQPIQNHS